MWITHITIQDVQMVNKCVKRFLTSLAIGEMQVKTTEGCQVWQDESIDDKSDESKFWGRFGKVTACTLLVRMENRAAAWENCLAGFCCCCFKINILNLQSSHCIFKYLTKKVKTCPYKDLLTDIHKKIYVTAQTCKQPKWPSTG